MDISVIGAWGELLGGVSGLIAAVGVVLTLLYLARQIRQNTEQTRAEVAHGLMASLRDAVVPLTELTNADIVLRGFNNRDTLSETERFVASNINIRFYRVTEEAFLHYKAGRLEETYWESISGQLGYALTIPGVREDWSQRRTTTIWSSGNGWNLTSLRGAQPLRTRRCRPAETKAEKGRSLPFCCAQKVRSRKADMVDGWLKSARSGRFSVNPKQRLTAPSASRIGNSRCAQTESG